MRLRRAKRKLATMIATAGIAIAMLFATIGLTGCGRVTTVFAYYEGSAQITDLPIVMNAGDSFTVTNNHFSEFDIDFERVEIRLQSQRIVGDVVGTVIAIQGNTITAKYSGRVTISTVLIEQRDGNVVRRWGLGLTTIYVIDETTKTHVTTADELQNLTMTGHYILMDNIDLYGIDWQPIGGVFVPEEPIVGGLQNINPHRFRGMLVNPHGFVIDNLTINSFENLSNRGSISAGLFEEIDNALIYGLILENVYINLSDFEGYSIAGGIVGRIRGTAHIINNSVEGFISAGNEVGGIAAYCSGRSRISNNEFTGTVKQHSDWEMHAYGAGGIVGFTALQSHVSVMRFFRNSGLFNNRVINATIIASHYAGGIIGFNFSDGKPIGCTFDGKLYGGRGQGELIGFSRWQHLWE